MDEVQGQVQEDSQTSGPEVIGREEGQVSEEQSETSEDVAEVKSVFTDHLGRELTPEQLHEEYMKTQSYVTKLEQERAEWEKSAQKEAAKAVAENEHLQDVDPNVREAIVQIVTPVIEDSLRRRDAEAQQRAQNEAFDRRLKELKTKYPGGDGLPKFDEVKVLAAMRDPNNSIYDPEALFKIMNWNSFLDHANKQAMKGKSSDTKTEDTGGSAPRKPGSDSTPKSFDEATRRAISRMTG